MRSTKWNPDATPIDLVLLELGSAVRGVLPIFSEFGLPAKESGEWKTNPLAQMVSDGVHLVAVTWRTLERMEWQERASIRGMCTGWAWKSQRRVDFTVDYIRDIKTGAYVEFDLVSM